MFEELDPVVMPLEKVLGGIENCLYGRCPTCPMWNDVKSTPNKTRVGCMEELLYQAEHHLKGYSSNRNAVKIVVQGRPITKKNSSQIISVAGRPRLTPSKQYKQYRTDFMWQIPGQYKSLHIDKPVNMKCVYYMPTHHKVDLANLIAASCDILVDAGVLLDDNSNIVASHDGSCVLYDKENPRAEIVITDV